ncbi:MAG: winged helix-turn-helix domain-containing protein [Victivallales bacterium]|nr:winged helix-turn-helix domain-containing protein [Victivallales bacterium]
MQYLKKQKDDGLNDGLNKRINNVYNVILGNPGIRTPAITAKTGKSIATVERAVSELKKQGKIEFRGAPKTGGYYCKDEPLA